MGKESGTQGSGSGKPSGGHESRPIDLTHQSQKGLPQGNLNKAIRPGKGR